MRRQGHASLSCARLTCCDEEGRALSYLHYERLGISLNVVTGAYSYIGSYIARRLVALGEPVRTLTGHPNRPDPFGGQVPAFPFNFDNSRALADSLRGAETLYNTYWVRFPRGRLTFETAVENTKKLIGAAEEAGVSRIVHISVTNCSETSPLPYYKGKALLEKAIVCSKLSYAIVRPTLVFGTGDILINNIAWLLRRFPLFPVFGLGEYRVQPIFAEDLAEIAVDAGHQKANLIIDAAGPDIYKFDELVRLIAKAIGGRARIIHASPEMALLLGRPISLLTKDTVITENEIKGLMSNLLVSALPPAGKTSFREWLERNAPTIGTKYASELTRHFR
ncbi:MAG: NAD(P)H-binding protein [Chloroflexi bacterium]|nr:NAD(P)H-binding protein [Chloroflexota bacterium]